jgi:hypothetical protein
MKKLLFTLAAILLALSVQAQDEGMPRKELDPKVQERIKAARVAFITERLALTPEEAEKFWPVYRELSEKRLALREQFEQKKNNPDPKKTVEQNEKDLMDYGFQLRQKELDLDREYAPKILNAIPSQKMMMLRKAEDDFRLMIMNQIQKRQGMQQQRDDARPRQRQRN